MDYQVNISPTKSPQLAASKLLVNLLGIKQKDQVERLLQEGGAVATGLNEKEAVSLATRLQKLGVKAEVTEMKPRKPNEQFRVRLLEPGKNDVAVTKIVLDMTKLDPKEVETIVYKKGVVAENLSKEDAERIKMTLEGAGARATIEVMSSPEPEPEPEEPKDPEQAQAYVVSGRVFNSSGIQLPYAPLALVKKSVGKDLPLAIGETETDGSYKIIFTRETEASKEHLDIQVHLLADKKNKNQILARSNVRYNAKPVEGDLDVVVPTEKLPQAEAEYSRLLKELQQQLGAKTEVELEKILAALNEDDEQQDISYLANKTGWDARLVAMLVLAHEERAQTDLPAPLAYSLYRAGIPTDENVLSTTNPATVKKIWERAIEQNVIDAVWREQLDKYLDIFRKTSSKILLNDETSQGLSSMDNLLSLSLKDEGQKQEFAERYFHQSSEKGDFWESIEEHFGTKLRSQLQLDGKLGVLTLNNAPLIKKLREQKSITDDPIELVRNGFYKVSAWEEILKDDQIPLPSDLPGEKDTDKQQIYAASMAQQLKASYPTAVLAAQIKSQELALVNPGSRGQVSDFLDKHQSVFVIGQQPITQFIKEKELSIEEPVVGELKRLERLYQISPSDEAMMMLSDNGINSAHAVVQLGEEAIVNKLVSAGLNPVQAQLVFAKSHQVQTTVLNVATAVITNRNTPTITVLNPPHEDDPSSGISAYPTLEGLFGEMDFCDCNHCRSVLSPAAYLVDLLQFINKDPADFEDRTGRNPLDVLLERRPDIEHIQLTCENTNTVLPYIDLVNEILEHYSVNKSLADFPGYNNTGDRSTEELVANPQFIKKKAYETLKEQVYPFHLPFNQPLAVLRRLFEHLDVPLDQAMKSLRPNEEIATWQNIHIEYLGISPEEYAIFTQNEKSVAEYYGEKKSVTDLNGFFTKDKTFAKDFSRKAGISYKELSSLVQTQFINPASQLIPQLEKLKISIHTIVAFIDGDISDAEFNALLPDEFDTAAYGGDIKAWLQEREEDIKRLILLVDDSGMEDECSFVQLELRCVNGTAITELDYFKLMRFIRFWKKMGWTIEQTDKTIAALWTDARNANTLDLLNEGFAALINRTAHLKRVMTLLNSNPKRDFLKALGLFGPIDTQGSQSLYKELFLNTTITDIDPLFSANSSQDYLTDSNAKVLEHEPAVLAAFNLNSENLRLVLQRTKAKQGLGGIEEVLLNLENVTTIHRYAYLSRQLKLSLREIFILQDLSQINPFGVLEEVNPSIIKFIELAQRLKQSPLTIPQVSYFLRHEDLSGEASPSREDLLAMAKQVNDALQQVENVYKATDDVNEEAVQTKMALVYSQETVNQFFNIIKNKLSFKESYAHHEAVLDEELRDATDKLSYNGFQKTLAFNGLMSDDELQELQTAAHAIPEANQQRVDFLTAIQALFDAGQTAVKNFFADYPELEDPYNAFTTSNDFGQLLSQMLQGFKKQHKKLSVTETLNAALGIELELVHTLLEDKTVLHANTDSDQPAIEDYLALESNGVSAAYVFKDDSESKALIKNINIFPGGLEFPDTQPIKRVTYSFYVEIIQKAFYNFNFETNNDAGVIIFVNNEEKAGSLNDRFWENTDPIELNANRYHLIEIQLTHPTDTAILRWTRENKNSSQLLPNHQLYPKQAIESLEQSYLRFLKAVALLGKLGMSQEEIRYFSTAFKIDEAGFLNAIPTQFDSSKAAIHQNLWQVILNFWDYRELKETFDVKDDRLTRLLANPNISYSDLQDDKKSLLLKMTGWSASNLEELLNAFGLERSDLKEINNFYRIWKAYQLVAASGLPARTLLESTTNSPDLDKVKIMQQAIRLKYDTNSWLAIIQEINDELRNKQRDALVAYVLQLMQQKEATKTVNTADKLFEYFLIDVEMDSCMKTSRIKQAISSVQLFVQRVLLNLEQHKGEGYGVDPASINSKQWEWMKRYRVWEANRKVFISPENWLEPELRDNKSPFFEELESELLQSDITEDEARKVLINYLGKLDDVARLDIAGMCLQENQKEIGGEYYDADDVLHVFGKSQGTTDKYYYRRYEGGYFSPWEKVDLDIEGAPILPVIWNNRLFLFWLNIIQKAAGSGSVPIKSKEGGGKLVDANFDSSALDANSKVNVEISLSWSEYYNGKWQARRMSDTDKPVVFKDIETEIFKRERIEMLQFADYIEKELDVLTIQFRYKHTSLAIYAGDFKLKNKYTASIGFSELLNKKRFPPEFFRSLDELLFRAPKREITTAASATRVNYYEKKSLNNPSFSHVILVSSGLIAVEPKDTYSSPYHTPFFVQNDEHVFFVQLKEKWIPIQNNNDFGVWRPPFDLVTDVNIPTVVEIPDIRQVPVPGFDFDPGYIDPVPPGFNFDHNNIKFGLPDDITVVFNNRTIDASGSLPIDINRNPLNQ